MGVPRHDEIPPPLKKKGKRCPFLGPPVERLIPFFLWSILEGPPPKKKR